MVQDSDSAFTSAIKHRNEGHATVEIVELLLDEFPNLRSEHLRLAQVLRNSLGLTVVELHYVSAWVQGLISRQEAENRVGRDR